MPIALLRSFVFAALRAAGGLAAGWLGPAGLPAVHPPPTAPVSAAVLDWDTGANRSYVIPGIQLPIFLTALSLYDRHVYGKAEYGSTANSTIENVAAVA